VIQGSWPFILAQSSSSSNSGQSEFHLAFWDRPIRLTYPAFTAHPGPGEEELPSFQLAMLLYYFSTADGSPLEYSWISFSELPDGRFYNQAFQGYTGRNWRAVSPTIYPPSSKLRSSWEAYPRRLVMQPSPFLLSLVFLS